MTHRTTRVLGDEGVRLIVANALVRAAIIVAVAAKSSGTSYVDRLLPMHTVAAGGSLVLATAGVRRMRRDAKR